MKNSENILSTLESIEIIQRLETAKPVVDEMLKKHESTIVLPDNYRLHDIEHLLPAPIAFCGTFNTSNLSSFSEYVADNKQETTACFINADTMKATAIITLGTNESPAHRRHIAELSLESTAPYRSILKADGNAMQQEDFAFWLQDWADYIILKDEDGATIQSKDAIKAVRKIKFEHTHQRETSVQNLKAEKSELESIEVSTDGKPPLSLDFSCIPFKELPERVFSLRIQIINAEKPKFVVRIISLECEQEEMAEDFKNILVSAMPDTVKTRIGVFSTK